MWSSWMRPTWSRRGRRSRGRPCRASRPHRRAARPCARPSAWPVRWRGSRCGSSRWSTCRRARHPPCRRLHRAREDLAEAEVVGDARQLARVEKAMAGSASRSGGSGRSLLGEVHGVAHGAAVPAGHELVARGQRLATLSASTDGRDVRLGEEGVEGGAGGLEDARIASPWSVLGRTSRCDSHSPQPPATLRTRIDGLWSVAPDQRLSAISVKVASAASRMRAMTASS